MGETTIENPNFTIGDRIKNLRVAQKRTLQELGDSCGLSKSMISKIETNKTVPSVATLVKIAQSLGTSISGLLEHNTWSNASFTSMHDAEQKLAKTDKGYSIFPFASEFHEKKMQPFLFTAKQGEVKTHSVSHEGEEFIFVVDGEMKMQIGDIEYTLKTGDSLYFNAIQKHGIMPVSELVTYIDIFV